MTEWQRGLERRPHVAGRILDIKSLKESTTTQTTGAESVLYALGILSRVAFKCSKVRKYNVYHSPVEYIQPHDIFDVLPLKCLGLKEAEHSAR
jgi:hypothetical protein